MDTTPDREVSAREITAVRSTGVAPPPMEASPLEWAVFYREQYSWAIYPIDRESMVPLAEVSAPPTLDEVRGWWSEFPSALVGLALGEPSGVIAAVWVEGSPKAANYRQMSQFGTLTFEITNGGRAWLVQQDDYWTGLCALDEDMYMLGTGCFVLLPPVNAEEGELMEGRFAGTIAYDDYDAVEYV